MKLILMSLFLWAATGYSSVSVDAPGKIFYKTGDNSIVQREAVLQVPARGEGKVYLKSGRISVEAQRFFSRQLGGRTIFYVIFDQYPGQQNNDLAVYRGTYTRGSNMALYYGDVFTIKNTQSIDEDFLHDEMSLTEQGSFGSKYVAGFYFKSEISGEN